MTKLILAVKKESTTTKAQWYVRRPLIRMVLVVLAPSHARQAPLLLASRLHQVAKLEEAVVGTSFMKMQMVGGIWTNQLARHVSARRVARLRLETAQSTVLRWTHQHLQVMANSTSRPWQSACDTVAGCYATLESRRLCRGAIV